MKTLKVVLGALLMVNFAVIVAAAAVVLFPDVALAAEGGAAAAAGSDRGMMMIGSALAVGLGCVGAGIAVAQVGAAALGAIGEKPDMLGKTLIFVGLAEGIAIYGLIISIMIYASAG